MLDRSRARAAATDLMRDVQTNSIATSYIWRVVNAVLDDVEEQAREGTLHAPEIWVVRRADGALVAASYVRNWLRRWIRKTKGTKVSEVGYTIHPVPFEPPADARP